MIVVKEMTKETVRAAVRKAAQIPRKTDFTPSRMFSVLAVVTTNVSPKIVAQTTTVAGQTSIKSKMGGFVQI